MDSRHRGVFLALWLVPALLLLTLTTIPLAAQDFTENPPKTTPAANLVIVRFHGAPLSSANLPVSAEDGQLDLATPQAQAYQSSLIAAQEEFINYLSAAAPNARVTHRYTITYNGTAVVLNGAAVDLLLAGPNVATVRPSRTFRPTMNVSTELISAHTLWNQVGGATKAGAGVKVGVIDSGIDHLHPFLSDASLRMPRGFPKCDFPENCSLTSTKVIVAREYPKSETYTAADIIGHGSHVSGTIAGVNGTSAPVVSTTLSGVAPKAWLGNYNVFPGQSEGAFEVDIIDALEDAVRDRMNVLNMSLGGPAPQGEDPLADAVNATVDAGIVVAIAAGNSGPGSETIESPGVAEKAITAGASTNRHFSGISVNSPVGSFGAALGQFEDYNPPVTAAFTNWTAALPGSGEACEPNPNPNFQGKIVLIRRGGCNFTLKVRNAELAGAVGVIMINNVAGDPVAMGHDGTEPKPVISAAMVSSADGDVLRQSSGSLTVDGTATAEFITQNHDIMAGFSSRGPTPFTFRIKPDVTAPGVNVYSSIPGGEYAFFQGTSMASPHVAGSAAVLRQLKPKWKPQDIKSALSTTAKRPVFSHTDGTTAARVMDRGTGRIDLSRAGTPGASVSPTNVSFGLQLPALAFTASQTIAVRNLEGNRTYSIVVEQLSSDPNVQVTVSPRSVTLKAGQSASLTLTVSSNGLGEIKQYEGDVVIFNSGSNKAQRVPYWFWITP